jgi:putative heme-binding domain-containing protein
MTSRALLFVSGLLFCAQFARAGKVLKTIDHPPEVQMFVPGFTARRLPLDLTNINNVRYRDDGKLVALAYNGNVYLLTDTNGDGLEDHAELFWENKGSVTAPIGLALTPPGYALGRGVFIACTGKLLLLLDTDGDDKADKEIVVATGWGGTIHPIDAVGVAIAPDGSIYFGLGCAFFADPYLKDPKGKAHYDLKSERGTILKVSPDFKHREIVCTGIRFSVGLAFNRAGDLFATDQEGATWLANGNPFDELLHIQPGRHYGFPPQHPFHLPNVIDEPSTFDYGPQHQSACGLCFDEPAKSGKIFGPDFWQDSAIVCGEARGKLWRTQLVKSPVGYVARNQIIGAIPMLVIDSCISSAGDLVVACHSGAPDWGSGPTGKGKLYKISYNHQPPAPAQPVLVYPTSPHELRIAFDRPLDPATLHDLTKDITIDFGQYVGAADDLEIMRPGYEAVQVQLRAPRFDLPVTGVQITSDRRTLILTTAEQRRAVPHSMKLPLLEKRAAAAADGLPQLDRIDLGYDLCGVQAEWRSADGSKTVSISLPHLDLDVARALTAGSAEHDAFWSQLRSAGTLTLRTNLSLDHMLHPFVQPEPPLDYVPAAETVTVAMESNVAIELQAPGAPASANQRARYTRTPKDGKVYPVEISMPTGAAIPMLSVSFSTKEDSRPRPLQLTRFILPWAQPFNSKSNAVPIVMNNANLPQLKGGDWLRGRDVFFGNEAACYKCHRINGRGGDLGPDLSSTLHRDVDSLFRDIRQPSAALNPDYIAYTVTLKNGQVLQGIPRDIDKDHLLLRGDAQGEKSPIARRDIAKITPSALSMMPSGILEGIGPAKTRDLLTFLLTKPLPENGR